MLLHDFSAADGCIALRNAIIVKDSPLSIHSLKVFGWTNSEKPVVSVTFIATVKIFFGGGGGWGWRFAMV
jgi:hypothetical protein